MGGYVICEFITYLDLWHIVMQGDAGTWQKLGIIISAFKPEQNHSSYLITKYQNCIC